MPDHSRGRVLLRRLRSDAAVLFVASSLVLGYHLLFQLTKPSVASAAPAPTRLVVAAHALLLAAALAAACLAVVRVVGLVARGQREDLGLWVGTTIALLCGVVPGLENLLYTATGVGLKSETSLAFHFSFVLAALSLSTFLAYRILRWRRTRVAAVAVALGILLVPAAVAAVVDARGYPRAAALSREDEAGARNVIVLSTDGLDAGRMSAYGYDRATTPFLDSRLGEFRVFDHSYTNNGHTTGSIASLLTGRSPLTTGVVYPPDLLTRDEAAFSLPRVLRRVGVRTENWSVPYYADSRSQNLLGAFDADNGIDLDASLTEMVPGAGVPRRFSLETLTSTGDLLAELTGTGSLTNAYAQVGEVRQDTANDEQRLASLERLIRSSDPFFAHVHLMVTHGPTFSIEEPTWSKGDEQTEIWQRDFYDDAILQFDREVSEVYAALEDAGRLDDTLLVITSDHGPTWSATTRVPLMVRWPDQRSTGRSARPVQRLDLAPTVLDTLGFSVPEWMEGHSLLDESGIPLDRQIEAASITDRQHVAARGVHGKTDLRITTIRCGRFLTAERDSVVERGDFDGPDSPCTDAPTQARPEQFSVYD